MELICKQCGKEYRYHRPDGRRGRNPVRCPDCITLPISKRYPKKKDTNALVSY
jgi:DNA-directed RNA polymerase subunit RPC12/RpoP